jgi:hypothetical protein
MMHINKQNHKGSFALGVRYTKVINYRDYLKKYRSTLHAVQLMCGPFLLSLEWQTTNALEKKLRKANA